MSESNEGVYSIEGMIRDVKATRVDTDSDHAECVLTRKSTTGAHPVHRVNILQAVWDMNVQKQVRKRDNTCDPTGKIFE